MGVEHVELHRAVNDGAVWRQMGGANEILRDSLIQFRVLVNVLLLVSMFGFRYDFGNWFSFEYDSSCCRFEVRAISFTSRCFSSLSCINEHLVRYRGGYENEQSSRNNCSLAVCIPEKSSWC